MAGKVDHLVVGQKGDDATGLSGRRIAGPDIANLNVFYEHVLFSSLSWWQARLKKG
jgi:hypothetical protein